MKTLTYPNKTKLLIIYRGLFSSTKLSGTFIFLKIIRIVSFHSVLCQSTDFTFTIRDIFEPTFKSFGAMLDASYDYMLTAPWVTDHLSPTNRYTFVFYHWTKTIHNPNKRDSYSREIVFKDGIIGLLFSKEKFGGFWRNE